MKKIILLSLFLTVIDWHTLSFATWQNFWWRRDQQGMQAFRKNQYAQAKDLFENPQWKATAAYRANDFKESADLYQQSSSATAYYNLGNALAFSFEYSAAIDAYEKALALDPNLTEAQYNKEIVEKLLQEQEEDKQNQNEQQNNPKEKDPSNRQQSNSQQKEQSKQQNNPQQKNRSNQQQTSQTNQQSENVDQEQNKRQMTNQNETKQDSEQNPQWLNRIEDDPGGLLRQKFLRDHKRYQQGNPS